MPKSFLGAKTCFTIVGRFWEFFSFGRGGVTYSQKYMSEWLPKSEHFHEDQKCSEGPKMQNKPYILFLETGVPKRGGGGGPTFGKNSPNFPFGWRPLSLLCDINCNANCNDGGARPR